MGACGVRSANGTRRAAVARALKAAIFGSTYQDVFWQCLQQEYTSLKMRTASVMVIIRFVVPNEKFPKSPQPPLQGGEMGFAHGSRLPKIISSETTIRITPDSSLIALYPPITWKTDTDVRAWTRCSLSIPALMGYNSEQSRFQSIGGII